MIDKANFYKLSQKDQKEEANDLWYNSSPNVIQFADNMVAAIKNQETPFVLGIDGGYGTGKTYFSTRFTEYLKQKEINAIYCSVFENDYLENPFIAISKELLKCSNLKNNIELVKTVISVAKILSPLLPVPDFLKNIINKYIEKIEKEEDSIERFKIQFKNSLKSQRLVLVIDELDRCRPDFAVKTLEVLKHFFDIDGLYVILMINKERLEKHINAFYNILDNESNDENFLQKFINRYENIPDLDYEIIVGDYLISDRLNKAIENKNIIIDECNFNSLQNLSEGIIECCKEKKLTYRQAIELINKCIEFCNNYKAPIRCRYLPHVFIDHNKLRVHFISSKTKLFDKIKNHVDLLKKYIVINPETGSENYKKIDRSVTEIKNNKDFLINKLNLEATSINDLINDYKNLKKLGSDDNDEKRVRLYEDIGKDFNKLYGDKINYI